MGSKNRMNRRDWLKRVAAGGGAALGAGAMTVDASASTKEPKLRGTKAFTTACSFCSAGCGMVCHVRDGKLVEVEGDPNHIINEGALCSKGASVIAAHESDRRARQPLYRAPGSDHWQPISWDEALEKVARKTKQVRDAHWIGTEAIKDPSGKSVDYAVNRTDAIGFMGGAQNTNEECYLITKMSRLLGSVQVEHQARL